MHDEDMPSVQTWLTDTAWDDERRFQYLQSVLSNRRLLDCGCGARGFLSKAQKLTATEHGVELEIRLSSHYQKHGFTAFQNPSDIPNNIRGEYDIITMFHVLEHVPDPRRVLIELSEFLMDDRQIIIEAPNADDALFALY